MNKKEAVLECGDHVRIDVATGKRVGDDAYCRFHGYSPIAEVFHREWRIICIHCTYGRWCGQSESAAKKKADRHKHNCIVVNDGVTASGGTPRKQLIKMALRTTGHTATLIENELPPY